MAGSSRASPAIVRRLWSVPERTHSVRVGPQSVSRSAPGGKPCRVMNRSRKRIEDHGPVET